MERNNYQKNIAYKKSLDLDDQYEPHLTLGMLNSVRGTGDSETVVRVIQRILVENAVLKHEPSDEIEIRGQMNSHLIKLGRYDEVYENLDYMEKTFLDFKDLIAFRREFSTKKIEKIKQDQQQSSQQQKKL